MTLDVTVFYDHQAVADEPDGSEREKPSRLQRCEAVASKTLMAACVAFLVSFAFLVLAMTIIVVAVAAIWGPDKLEWLRGL